MRKDLHRHFLISVPENQRSERIDVFLSNRIRNYTRSNVKNLCDQQKICIGETPVKANYPVKPCEDIYILLPYSSFREADLPVNIPLDIIFEDESCIVVNKPAGIAVHTGLGDYQNTVMNGLLFHLKTRGEPEEVYVVHRLDKHTTGPLVFAKTLFAQDSLASQFHGNKAERVYHCLVWGSPSENEGIIDTFMGRNTVNPDLIEVSTDKSFGKRAVTHYRVLKSFRYASLMECVLETGRTHQIRIHMQFTGTPVVGDRRYPGAPAVPEDILREALRIMPHQALHARTLCFTHPARPEKLIFSADYPQAFLRLIDFLESL